MNALIGCAIGALGGLVSGLLGISGGVLMTPLLVLLLGLEQHTAQAVSLAAVVPPVGYPALVGYRRQGVKVPWRLVFWLLVSFTVFGVFGAYLVQRLPETPLRDAFACLLVAVAIRTVVLARKDRSFGKRSGDLARTGFWPGCAIGAIGGTVSGMFGIGGAVVMIPLLQYWARIDRLTAQVTTLAMMLPPIGLPVVAVYAAAHPLPWLILVAVAFSFPVGSWFGGRVAPRMPGRQVGYLFAAVLLVAALALLMR
jgi:uncharacterized membrane protein YfcA